MVSRAYGKLRDATESEEYRSRYIYQGICMALRLGTDALTYIVVHADAVLGLALGELIVATVEYIDIEAFALGSYYCQVACIFQFIYLLSADFSSCRANLQSYTLYGLSYSVMILSLNSDCRSLPCSPC